MPRDALSCGRDLHYCPNLQESLKAASNNKFTFVAVPIVNPRYKREHIEGVAYNRPPRFTRSDMILPSSDWTTLVVGKVSSWIDVDSADETRRILSEKALIEELSFMTHLGLPAVMIELRSMNCSNLARFLKAFHEKAHAQSIWVKVPIVSPQEACKVVQENPVEIEELEQDTWQWWNKLRVMCGHSQRIFPVLGIPVDFPQHESLNIQRWVGEQVKCVVISTEAFLTNKHGFPVLSRAHQSFLRAVFKIDCQVLLSGHNRHSDKPIMAYQQYLSHLYDNRPDQTAVEKWSVGFEDYLQLPLQPLSDNLESHTYEVFEKDPTKYALYQKAIKCAILDKVPAEEKDSRVLTLMVLGAGRGPLVRAALNAAELAARQVKITAVEKNLNAVVTLLHQQKDEWGTGKVDIVYCDMREYEPKEKADIIISELLGSFGDNELSPECLDGAQRFLKDDGVSIPQKYTSYIAPLQSPKLYSEIQHVKDSSSKDPFEAPYVVRLHNRTEIDDPKALFTFSHPKKDKMDNSRFQKVDFTARVSALMHGIAGYFDCNLYKDIVMSIVPNTHSEGMFSWFPIFFPLKEPVAVAAGDTIEICFWRCTLKDKVWYEWNVNQPITTPIHNVCGRAYSIGLL